MENGLNRHLSLEDLTIANKYMKRYPKPLVINKMEIKLMMRYPFNTITWLC